MNYQKMRDAPMNYQLGQNKGSNYQLFIFCPIPSVRPVNMDGICRFWTLILIKRQKCPQLIKKMLFYFHFLPIFPPWTTIIFQHAPMNYYHFSTCPHVKRHVTVTWPVDWRKGGKWLSLVVECSILVELVVHEGIAYFLVVHREKM